MKPDERTCPEVSFKEDAINEEQVLGLFDGYHGEGEMKAGRE